MEPFYKELIGDLYASVVILQRQNAQLKEEFEKLKDAYDKETRARALGEKDAQGSDN